MIVIRDLPVPLTTNKMYATIMRRGPHGPHTRRIPSSEFVDFKREMSRWAGKYASFLSEVQALMAYWIVEGYMIQIDLYICLGRTRLFTLKDTPKRLDASNRIKAMEDAISEITLVDDKHFWRVSAEKIECEAQEDECTIAILTPIKARKRNSLENILKKYRQS